MEKVTQLEAYLRQTDLFKHNFSKKSIADLAFEFYNKWSDENSKESYEVIYDLALLEEPGMELNYGEIKELIDKLYNMDFESNNEAEKISRNFNIFSSFFLELGNYNCTESEFHKIYQKLEEIYFLALVDCSLNDKDNNWEKYRLTAMKLIKELFQFNPYIFKTHSS